MNKLAVYIYIDKKNVVKTNIWPERDHGGVLFLGFDDPVKTFEEWEMIGLQKIKDQKLNENADKIEKMDLNKLVIRFSSLKEKLPIEDQKTIDLMNEVCKMMYLQIRMLATRQDLTFWYQNSSCDVLKKIDEVVENEHQEISK